MKQTRKFFQNKSFFYGVKKYYAKVEKMLALMSNVPT